MSEKIEQVSLIEEDDQIGEEEIFNKIKEIMEKDKSEYPNSSLFSMVIDSVNGKRSIFRVNTDFENSSLQEDFEIINK